MDQSTRLQKRVQELELEVHQLELENSRLRQKARLADSANQAKSEFLAMISHEIRTPMNGVIGISELLLDTELQPRQKHFAGLIRTSAASLLTLINNLLDFSKIEANKMALDIEPFALPALLEQVLSLYQVTGRRKGLKVAAEIDPTLAPQYLGDVYRLRQVLVNLLGNAVKFTEQGTITLRVLRTRSDDHIDLLRFEVEDTGVGIAAESIAKLFRPFSQVDSSSTRRYGGTGLGLSICAQLVKLMDGELGVHSVLGQGATFWFSLPLAVVKDTAPGENPLPPILAELRGPGEIEPPQEQEADQGLRLLIVDDEETNRVVMAEIFRQTGVGISLASNGQEAIEACRRTRYPIIFMDCQMPVVDGFEATRTILAEAAGQAQDPPAIIALTADATAATKKRCIEVGMVDYLIKPIDFKQLQEVLTNWLPERSISVIPGAGARTAATGVPASEGVSPVIDTVALARLREHVGDITPVAAIFLSSLKRRLNELAEAIAHHDPEAINKVAHTIKGSSSQFGAMELAHLCLLAENMGKSGNLQQIDRIYKQIVVAADKVHHFFTEQLD